MVLPVDRAEHHARRAVRRGRPDAAPLGDETRLPPCGSGSNTRTPESGPTRAPKSTEGSRPRPWLEVLRHKGIRIEELTALSHHSLIQYRLPATGELIPLLQITPSKTDQERLLVISPELADVLSNIIGRIRGDDQPDVPLVVSYEQKERVYNPPMPLLFQFRRRLEGRAVSEESLRGYVDHALLVACRSEFPSEPF